jgi:hypothetical protein
MITDEQFGQLMAAVARLETSMVHTKVAAFQARDHADAAKRAAILAFDEAQRCNQTLAHLPCVRRQAAACDAFGGAEADTSPATPNAISEAPARPRQASLTEAEAYDSGRPSSLTQPASMHAGPLSFRGPAWIAAALGLAIGMVVAIAATRGVHLPF